MSRHARRGFCLLVPLLMMTSTGCFYIPTWRCPTPPPCQAAENTLGDVVDFISHQSTIDKPCPCHPADYSIGIVYRVAPPGTFLPGLDEPCDQNPAIEAPLPHSVNADDRSLYLKP